MIDANDIPPIDDAELLTRFILQSSLFRRDGTVKPGLFLPYSLVELSVNRHRDATIEETWDTGRAIAYQRGRTLYGRADIRARACRISPLNVVPKPILPANPNHADIIGFPPGKEEQMSYSAKLAASIEGSMISTPIPNQDDGK